mmetsp:Transcript_16590/g.24561  ORF Transcript_16590/g.24561 Transcript_16590/m.24561 type:complete len:538 (-) Transcript_16590:636-2249(-)
MTTTTHPPTMDTVLTTSGLYKTLLQEGILPSPSSSPSLDRCFDEDELLVLLLKYKDRPHKITPKVVARECPTVTESLRSGALPDLEDTIMALAATTLYHVIWLERDQDELREVDWIASFVDNPSARWFATKLFARQFIGQENHSPAAAFTTILMDEQARLEREQHSVTTPLFDQRALDTTLEKLNLTNHPLYKTKYYEALFTVFILQAEIMVYGPGILVEEGEQMPTSSAEMEPILAGVDEQQSRGYANCLELGQIIDNISEVQKPILDSVLAVLREIVHGADLIKYTCWSCDKANIGTMRCKSCKVARYCSKECQRSDWKSDHKGRCKAIGILNGQYEQKLHHVDAATTVRNNEAGGRSFILDPRVAFRNIGVVTLLSCWSVTEHSPNGSSMLAPLKGPSMAYLHKNLTKLARGDFVWLVHPVIPKVNAQEISPEEQKILFEDVELLLSYDVSDVQALDEHDFAPKVLSFFEICPLVQVKLGFMRREDFSLFLKDRIVSQPPDEGMRHFYRRMSRMRFVEDCRKSPIWGWLKFQDK